MLTGHSPVGTPERRRFLAANMGLILEISRSRFKGAMSPFVYFEKIGKIFQNRHFQSVSIFAILSYPCSFLL